MKKLGFILLLSCLVISCSDDGLNNQGDPIGTVYYTESFVDFANPERGFNKGSHFLSNRHDTVLVASVSVTRKLEKMTLYQDSYYLTDFIESDIPDWYLERFDRNMQSLRKGGAKVVLRFAYKSDMSNEAKPWDATPQWMSRHIEQLEPHLKKNADVIYCMQAGFIGVWGEWCYTSTFPFNPQTDEEYQPRWDLLDQMLNALPSDRQICVRTPAFKMRYLQMHGLPVEPLSEEEAYGVSPKARIAAHNDCFVSSHDDWGTYNTPEERDFWAEDTRYTVMGGETCSECAYSEGDNAIEQMEKYHWTHLSIGWHPDIISSWRGSGHFDEISRRLGYRFVLDKAWLSPKPKAGEAFEARLTLRNVGFAALVNPRDVELIFVSKEDSATFVYKQDIDPRRWLPGETSTPVLSCILDEAMHGPYEVFLNLPDPYPSLHDNPDFSIRLANKGVWNEEKGYNRLGIIKI